MAQLLGPDAGSRLVYVLSGGYLRSAAGRTATIYTNAAGTILAAINTYDGTGVPAGLIAGSVVTVDQYSRLPLFWFPNNVDTVYAKVNVGGPVIAINADYDARLDAATGAAASPTVVAETAYGLPSSAGVAADFSRGDHTHGSPALPTKADVGLGNVDNTSDANKPVSTATQTALNAKNTLLVIRKSRLATGDIAVPNSGGAFALFANTTIAIPAVVGDYVELEFDFMHNLTGNNFLDWVVVVAGASVRAASSDVAAPGTEGLPSLYPGAASFSTLGGPFGFVAVSGDISGGNVTFQLIGKTTGVGTIFRSATYPMTLLAKNYGAVNFA